MKTRYIAALATVSILSLAANANYLWEGYNHGTMERACAQTFNVYGCHWQLQPIPPEQAASSDPIGALIKAGGILPPPVL